MGIETLSIRGISCGEKARRSVTPSGQSLLVDPVGVDKVLIVRPLREEFSGLPFEEEFARRQEAIGWHERNLPEHTLKTNLVILEGAPNGNDDNRGKSVPLLGRLTPRLVNVQSVSEMPGREVINDGELCLVLAKINLAYFKEFLRSGASFDLGARGVNNGSLSLPASLVTSYMVSSNIMVGETMDGERRIFCDPDWFIRLSDIRTDLLFWNIRMGTVLVKRAGLCFARSVFFSTAFLVNKTKEKKEGLSDNLRTVLGLSRISQ